MCYNKNEESPKGRINNMKQILPAELIKLSEICPYPLYVVGGKTRDFLAGLNIEGGDTDICAPSSADDFLKRAQKMGFKAEAVYKKTGTVKIAGKEGDYEFASFRSDRYIRGEHTPSTAFFTDDILLDAKRRDFKCNAVYYDISAGQFVDPLGGTEDIKEKKITTADFPEKVFGEDGLRLMRLARIAAQTGFTPAEECLDAARKKCSLISDISAERIREELMLILSADAKYGLRGAQERGLKILEDIGVLNVILPEIAAGKGIAQRADFHKYDVLEHTLRCVYYAPPEIRLAALLHDVGKPACFKKCGNFHGHEKVGGEIAINICRRLKMPKKISEETARLVETHMYDFRCDARECKIRRFIVDNYDIMDKILMIKQADYSACKDDRDIAPSVKKIRAVMQKMEDEGAPFTLKQLNIKGDMLIKEGVPPEKVGKILAYLLYECAAGNLKNDENRLLAAALKIMQTI